MQYLILGMHRSGTSLLSRLMNLMGASVGDPEGLGRPAHDNQRGFWERWEVAFLNNRILQGAGGAWDDVAGLDFSLLPEAELKEIDDLLRDIVFRMDVERPWILKDPRFSLTLDYWVRQLESPFFLLAVRHPVHVARSLLRRNEIPLSEGIALWEWYNRDAVMRLRSATLTERSLVVDYERLLAAPHETVVRLHSRLVELGGSGLRLPGQREIEAFIARDLDHAQEAVASGALDSSIESEAVSRYRVLQAGHLAPVGIDPWDVSLKVRETLQARHAVLLHQRGDAVAEPSVFAGRSIPFAQAISDVQQFGGRDAVLVDIAERVGQIEQGVRSTTNSLRESVHEAAATSLAHAQALAQDAMGAIGAIGRTLQLVERDSKGTQAASISELREFRQEIARLTAELEAREARALDRVNSQTVLAAEAVARTLEFPTQKKLEQAHRWFDEIERLHVAVFSSMRWRIGNALCRPLEVLTRRTGSVAAADLRSIDQQVRAWRHAPDTAQGAASAETSTETNVAAPSAASRSPKKVGSIVKGVSAVAINAAKRLVHGCISLLPIAARSKETIRTRIFELQESLLQRTPSTSMLEDLRALASSRFDRLEPREASEQQPRICLSVVLFNSESHIPAFIESLAALHYPLGCVQLLVVDHSPGGASGMAFDAAIGPLRDKFDSIRVMSQANRGFGAGHNRNLRDVKSNVGYFLVCNVDGALDPACLCELANAASQSDATVVAWEARQIPFEHPKYYDPVTMETSWVSGACVMFRKATLEACAGFEPRIFMYGEDVDLSYRMRRRGGRLLYVPGAVFRHDTYSEAEEFKPRQFLGSTLASMFLRLRFGQGDDLAAVPVMWTSLVPTVLANRLLSSYLAQTARLLWNAPYFLWSRDGGFRVPFAGWDYGLRREGAFIPVQPPQARALQPLVSIVVRTYGDRGELLRQALRSVANQTYRNIEVVVAEDGGDRAQAVCVEVATATGLRIRHLALDKVGRCGTGNSGLAATTGELMGFLDDDDLFFADHLELLVAALQRHPSIGAAYGLAWEAWVRTDEQGRQHEMLHHTIAGHRVPFSREVLSRHNLMSIQSVLFRRELYEKFGGFDEALDMLEDWDLWRRYSYERDFLLVEKTTSVYHVPANRSSLVERQLKLDEYYHIAKARFERFRIAQQAASDKA